MVFRLLFDVVAGAVFGFLLGLAIELFPRFNGALLDGLSALTGLSGVRTAALLAAIGLIGGILTGLLHEAVHVTVGHRRKWVKDHEW